MDTMMNNVIVNAMTTIMDRTDNLTKRCIHCRGDVLCEPCEDDKADIFNALSDILIELEPDGYKRFEIALQLIDPAVV
jgi:hypothetical protein